MSETRNMQILLWVEMFRLLLILHNLSSRRMNLVGNGLIWRCWHDMQPAEETATVKSSSSVVCRQHAEMVEAAEIGCTGKIQQQVLRQNAFFQLLALS